MITFARSIRLLVCLLFVAIASTVDSTVGSGVLFAALPFIVKRSATEPGSDGSIAITKTYQYFDLETFESKKETKTINFKPAASLSEAQERVGNDEGVLLKALNAYLRSQELLKAENEVTSKGGRKSVVMAVIKPFRSFGSFATMFKKNPDGSVVVENGEKVIDRKAQTEAILKMLKGSPEIIEQIKLASASPSEGDESDNEDQD